MSANVTGIKNAIKQESGARISDETVMAIALDMSSFPKLFNHAFEVWEQINDKVTDGKIADGLNKKHKLNIHRTTVGNFRKQIVEKYGLISKDASESFVESISRRARMAVIPRVNAFEGFNAQANFAEMVIMDTMADYQDAIKTSRLPAAQRMALGLDVDESKESAVKRHKDAAVIYTNAISNMTKLAGGEDVEFRELTTDQTNEQREAVHKRLQAIADKLAK